MKYRWKKIVCRIAGGFKSVSSFLLGSLVSQDTFDDIFHTGRVGENFQRVLGHFRPSRFHGDM